ncbi:biopolymer transport protein ExbD [Verrucomicrobium sp. GAS474]|uniref:ExbD/TolR family protein n=1 Tax=Verrucomicrobium sp. GAS474 TaxID=1882831 RepID=UPI00087D3081|nr:biopolymer transporter ExbD [Verrucomicrobium sp. GAS474]SDT91290.1 biopolymer transport protein ExbD [Verrucomicrobium sp. GAS474]
MAKLRKKRVNRALQDDGGEPEFQVAPMADLLFVLLVFFMSITTVEVLRTDKNVKLPVAKDSKENKQKGHQVVINVRWDIVAKTGSMYIDDQTVPDTAALTSYLQGKVSADPVLRVLLRADKSVEYAYVADLMRACGQAGISNVTFAVLSGEQPGQQKAQPAGGG